MDHVGIRGNKELVKGLRFFRREDYPVRGRERVRIDERLLVRQMQVQWRLWLDGIVVGNRDSGDSFRVRS